MVLCLQHLCIVKMISIEWILHKNFVFHMAEHAKDAKVRMAHAQIYQENCYDFRNTPVSFSVGDEVLLITQNLPVVGTKKFHTRFTVPFNTWAKVNQVSFKLNLSDTYRLYLMVYIYSQIFIDIHIFIDIVLYSLAYPL